MGPLSSLPISLQVWYLNKMLNNSDPRARDKTAVIDNIKSSVIRYNSLRTTDTGTATGMVLGNAELARRMGQKQYELARPLFDRLDSMGRTVVLSRTKSVFVHHEEELEPFEAVANYHVWWRHGFTYAKLTPEHADIELKAEARLEQRVKGNELEVLPIRMEVVPAQTNEEAILVMDPVAPELKPDRIVIWTKAYTEAPTPLKKAMREYMVESTVAFQKEFPDLPKIPYNLVSRFEALHHTFQVPFSNAFKNVIGKLQEQYASSPLYFSADRHDTNMGIDFTVLVPLETFIASMTKDAYRQFLSARRRNDLAYLLRMGMHSENPQEMLALWSEQIDAGLPYYHPHRFQSAVRHLDLTNKKQGLAMEGAPASHSLAPVLYGAIPPSAEETSYVLSCAKKHGLFHDFPNHAPLYLHAMHIMAVGERDPTRKSSQSAICRDLEQFLNEGHEQKVSFAHTPRDALIAANSVPERFIAR